MKQFIRLITCLILLQPWGVQAGYCLYCARYSVSDLVSLHRAGDGEHFEVESVTFNNTPTNSHYSASITRRDMESNHMFDFSIKGKGTGNINIIIELNRSFTHKCSIVIHNSAEIGHPEVYVDTSRCDPKFQISPIRGGHGYYLVKAGYYDK